MNDPYWLAQDVAELRDDFAAGRLSLQELEAGLDDAFGVDGGCGHASWCYLFLPSGACNCGGWS